MPTWDELIAAIDDAREYSIPEAAAVLGIPRSTAYVRLEAINAQVNGMLLYTIGRQVRLRGRALKAVAGLLDGAEIVERVTRLEERHAVLEERVDALEQRGPGPGGGGPPRGIPAAPPSVARVRVAVGEARRKAG